MTKALKAATAKARAEYNQGRTQAALDAIITGLEEVAKLEPKAPAAVKAAKPAKADKPEAPAAVKAAKPAKADKPEAPKAA